MELVALYVERERLKLRLRIDETIAINAKLNPIFKYETKIPEMEEVYLNTMIKSIQDKYIGQPYTRENFIQMQVELEPYLKELAYLKATRIEPASRFTVQELLGGDIDGDYD